MATEKRAYLSKSFEDLEQIAAANLGDEKIIARVVQELGHRKSTKAKKLLVVLNSGSPISLTPQSKRSVADARSAGVFQDCEVLLTSYELLRSTFGERGELLSRWGLTDSMPHDLLEKIGSMWIEKLATGYGDAIRTYEQLIRDFKQLEVTLPDPKRN